MGRLLVQIKNSGIDRGIDKTVQVDRIIGRLVDINF